MLGPASIPSGSGSSFEESLSSLPFARNILASPNSELSALRTGRFSPKSEPVVDHQSVVIAVFTNLGVTLLAAVVILLKGVAGQLDALVFLAVENLNRIVFRAR